MKEIRNLEEYQSAIKEKSVIVFSANWCPDCVFIKPFLPQLEQENSDFSFYSIDRDELLDLCIDLEITGIPSFVAYEGGKETGRFVSKLRKTKEEIQSFLDGIK